MQGETVIIGAGAAGLAAAVELASHGLPSIVMDARNRLGGRIFTCRDDRLDLPLELGAEFIHGATSAVHDWLRRTGEVAVDAAQERWTFRGARLEPADVEFEDLKRRLAKIAPPQPDVDFAAFLRRHHRPLPQHLRDLARSVVEGFDAADASRISARSVLAEWGGTAAADASTFRPARGYDSLIRAMRRTLTADQVTLRLGSTVRSVTWRKGRVDIEAVRHGEVERVTAARAIITLPLGVLQASADLPDAVRFDPELRSKQGALARLASGPAIKLLLRFSRPFWAEVHGCRYRDGAFFFARHGALPTFWTSLPTRAAALVAWGAGPNAHALASMSQAVMLDEVFGNLRRMFGRRDYASLLEAVTWHDWQRDPYARGAYSYVLAGGTRARHALAKPVEETLYFAGEACDTSGEAATVGGALRSGVRAAHLLMA